MNKAEHLGYTVFSKGIRAPSHKVQTIEPSKIRDNSVEAEFEFRGSKTALTGPATISFLPPKATLVLKTEAWNTAIGASFEQEFRRRTCCPLGFVSRKL